MCINFFFLFLKKTPSLESGEGEEKEAVSKKILESVLAFPSTQPTTQKYSISHIFIKVPLKYNLKNWGRQPGQ